MNGSRLEYKRCEGLTTSRSMSSIGACYHCPGLLMALGTPVRALLADLRSFDRRCIGRVCQSTRKTGSANQISSGFSMFPKVPGLCTAEFQWILAQGFECEYVISAIRLSHGRRSAPRLPRPFQGSLRATLETRLRQGLQTHATRVIRNVDPIWMRHARERKSVLMKQGSRRVESNPAISPVATTSAAGADLHLHFTSGTFLIRPISSTM